ncbi:MAG TPA: L,D-transpeptidase family protein, partial [Spongiibacteraceae bacterium]|nr:L,D-transpeptidase family protein [Spongiibacteraceae bacterium]
MRYFLLALCILLSINPTNAYTDVDNTAAVQFIHSHFEKSPATKATKTLRNISLEQALFEFYAARGNAPAWHNAHLVEQLFNELDNLRDDGLDPEDYHLSELHQHFMQLRSNELDAKQMADFDILASTAYLRSLTHLFRGKVNPTTLDPQWNFALHDMAISDAIKIVSEAIEKNDLHRAYERARPQFPPYLRTRIALAKLRAVAEHGGWPHLDGKETLKPGAITSDVITLRKRLLPDTVDNPQADVYDDELVAAVKKFQREQYLTVDGVVGQATRSALNVPIHQRIDQVRVNLERGRWQFHEVHGNFVLVDIAGYKIYFFNDEKIVWKSQVQVGRPLRQTPVFQAKITYVTFNPTWTVPPTILRKDILPEVRKKIGYLAKNNIRVFDTRGRELDPNTIDWNNPGDIVLRQNAGDDAALGQVAIRFPNPYSVYLHDTPHRELFDDSQRAFSSGCIRVERPLELVELLFNDPVNWNRAAIEAFIAKGETRNVNLPKPVPILLDYWTIDLLDDGTIGFK